MYYSSICTTEQLCGRNADSRNKKEKNLIFMTSTFSCSQKKNKSVRYYRHLPATDVRRMVRQTPNLASDFIVIRPTDMTVHIDFGFVLGSSCESRLHVLRSFSSPLTSSPCFAGTTFVFHRLLPSRQLGCLKRSLRHGTTH